MNRPVPNSTRLTNPMPDATNEGLHAENGVLYRRVILLEVQNIKYMTSLEMATGRPYDKIDLSKIAPELTTELAELVAQNIARGLNISIDTARSRVAQYYASANPTQIETPSQG